MTNNLNLTAHEFADLEGIDYLTAMGVIRYFREKGLVNTIRVRPNNGKRGRTATEYSIPRELHLTFGKPEPVVEWAEVVTETPVVEAPVVTETPMVTETAPVVEAPVVETLVVEAPAEAA